MMYLNTFSGLGLFNIGQSLVNSKIFGIGNSKDVLIYSSTFSTLGVLAAKATANLYKKTNSVPLATTAAIVFTGFSIYAAKSMTHITRNPLTVNQIFAIHALNLIQLAALLALGLTFIPNDENITEALDNINYSPFEKIFGNKKFTIQFK